jgi:glycosyltransferase involved in cell wall biosynthesis
VVTTSVVNEGLGAQPGREVLIADDAATTAKQITSLLRDEGLRRRVGQAGLHFVRQNYTWQKVSERMREIEDGLKAEIQ